MAHEIVKSVGENGKNLEADVTTIQKLLNSIAPEHGGASPPLKVDGKCGDKTKGAIQKFQLKHFGWKLADSRVDPEGPTHQKMRALAGMYVWKGTIFQLRRQQEDGTIVPPNEPYLFEVLDYFNKRLALYAFSAADINPGYAQSLRAQSPVFQGKHFSLILPAARSVTDLSGTAVHSTMTTHYPAPWPDLNSTKRESQMMFWIAGNSAAYAGVPFHTTGGRRFGRFQYLTELMPDPGRW